jgi:hypothetical protein
VRGVDAGPLIEAWLSRIASTASDYEKAAAILREKADVQDKCAKEEWAHHANLTLALRGAK